MVSRIGFFPDDLKEMGFVSIDKMVLNEGGTWRVFPRQEHIPGARVGQEEKRSGELQHPRGEKTVRNFSVDDLMGNMAGTHTP